LVLLLLLLLLLGRVVVLLLLRRVEILRRGLLGGGIVPERVFQDGLELGHLFLAMLGLAERGLTDQLSWGRGLLRLTCLQLACVLLEEERALRA